MGDGNGGVTASKTNGLIFGETITLTATPDAGWIFVGWTSEISAQNGGIPFSLDATTSIQVQDDTTYIANFAPAEQTPTDPNNETPSGSQGVYVPVLIKS